jgi:hypothetical protein
MPAALHCWSGRAVGPPVNGVPGASAVQMAHILAGLHPQCCELCIAKPDARWLCIVPNLGSLSNMFFSRHDVPGPSILHDRTPGALCVH